MQIKKEDLQVWRHHPVTQVFLQYLRDYQEALAREAWGHLLVADHLDELLIGEMRGRAKTLIELIDLPFEAMEQFYEDQGSAEGV